MAHPPIPLAQSLLRRALPPDVTDQRHEDSVIKRPLHLRPTSPEPSARAVRRRALAEKKDKARKRKALKPRPLSAAKKRELGLLEIPKAQVKWGIYLPLHGLWVGYMRDILGLGGAGGRGGYISPLTAGPILVSADMHGALVEVVRSRCVSRVGLRGIVVRDAQFVFEVVTEGDALKCIPKEHTIFRFEIPFAAEEGKEAPKPLVLEVNGEQFQHRAPDRANKKYKMHYQADI